jgi:dipeptidyl-peptidase-3
LPGVAADALKSYASAIEEARADLFGLYYMADEKMIELGLLPDSEAYKAQYYTYMLNGLLTQYVRIPLGEDIQEAHMRNRALIARWVYEHSDGAMLLERVGEKTYLRINDYQRVRSLLGSLLAEIQRIKSEGDFEAARRIVEQYGVKISRSLHEEILTRYKTLNIAPYKGFLNPRLAEQKDAEGNVIDISVEYAETYAEQMLRYSTEYSCL